MGGADPVPGVRSGGSNARSVGGDGGHGFSADRRGFGGATLDGLGEPIYGFWLIYSFNSINGGEQESAFENAY